MIEDFQDFFQLIEHKKYSDKEIEDKLLDYVDNDEEYRKILLLLYMSQVFKLRKDNKDVVYLKENKYFQFSNNNLLICTHMNDQFENYVKKNRKDKQQVIIVLQKQNKKSYPEFEFEVSYIHISYLLCPQMNLQTKDINLLDEVFLFDNLIKIDNKFPIIVPEDPLVILLGGKIGQVIQFEEIFQNQGVYSTEISYRLISKQIIELKDIEFSEED